MSLVVAIAIAVFWFDWLGRGGIFRLSKFDQETWFAAYSDEEKFGCYRGGMAHDIKERLLNPTMTRSDVAILLGHPDFQRANYYEYLLGMCSGLRIDYDGLQIYFSDRGTFDHAFIVQH